MCIRDSSCSGEEFEVTHGSMLGLNKDYYIALGLKYKGFYEFPFKKFYWAMSGSYTFEPLPLQSGQNKKEVNDRDSLFLGEPEKVLIEVKGSEVAEEQGETEPPAEPKAEENKDESPETPAVPEATEEPKAEPKNFTELDRLSYVVMAIENDTHVVPQGAFKLIPKHELRRSLAFKGLNREDLGKLKKYYHFRNVQSGDKKELLETTQSVFRENIFDPIADDEPKGAWSLQVNSSETLGIVKSLLWPGYVAYSVSGTKLFGGAYFGDGLKNKDLAFML
eukprot:TRINITY_DN7784_c0_g1_i6.p1 TRINITY_DN7784_c0_g1~~TRINITY_DN7784_c0_g1_i6.p1  ORF type:complete len:278 (+),score=73.31 TRINITY_DN7784_c0_g1_i6:72-905(+)